MTLVIEGGVVSTACTTTVRDTCVAALYVSSPAWFASMTHEPAPV
jgi:hypothetical protein